MKKRKLLLSVLLFTVMGMMTVTAISAPYIEGETIGWNQMGPNNYAGRTRAALFDKNNDGVIYVGSVGGLYVSVNYGKNWQEIPLGDAVQSVTAIAQSDDGRLYIATGEGNYEDFRGENPYGYSNQTSGSVGNGVFMQTQGFSTDWAKNLVGDKADSLKYDYIAKNFKFEVMANTKPSSKYAFDDDWAYINTILCVGNNLYIGTKKRIKYTSDVANLNATFSNISIDGNTRFNVSDICVNSNGKVAIAFNDNVAAGQGTDFKVIFNSNTDMANIYNVRGIGRIKLTFSDKNPNDLFIFAACNYRVVEYTPDVNGIIYGIYRPYYKKIKGGEIDENIGIENLEPNASNWFNVTTSSMAALAGTSLQYGMSIFVDDRGENEQIYLGGNGIYVGQDYNGEGKFSFSQITSATSEDTTGYNIGINIHNILPMPEKHNSTMSNYDSLFLFATSDMGAFRYEYDSVLGSLRWWSSFGFNNLQVYKVSATSDGSVIAATQSNAIVYLNQPKDTVTRGYKIWSINNPGYPYDANSTAYTEFQDATYSGSGANASAIYKSTPAIRKPILVSRPGTNLARSYSKNGDFDAIDDQTWTYGNSDRQTLISDHMADNFVFDPFNTPTSFWESFDFDKNIDSVEVSLTNNTIIYPNPNVDSLIYTYPDSDPVVVKRNTPFSFIDGSDIIEGDYIVVESDNLGYPFFHYFTASDLNNGDSAYIVSTNPAADFGNDQVLFRKTSNFKLQVPQPIQARALVATNVGAFICAKIMDFSRTINPYAQAENNYGNLTWARVYETGISSSADDYSTMNNRIHAVALSQDGSSAFLAVDIYNDFNTYNHTNLIRVSGLNDTNLANDRLFIGNAADITGKGSWHGFTVDTLTSFSRQISSIVCDPLNANNMVLTFEGVSSTAANVLQTTNALNATVDFTDISLNINRDKSSATKDKPVFTALYESVNSGKSTKSGRIYVGSDDGIYYRYNGQWVSDNEQVPNVAVYNLWQQTKKLPKWVYYSYTGENADLTTFEATENTGVIYAGTYGKGVLVNREFQDTIPIESTVALNPVEDNKTAESLRIYPNPAVDRATITYSLDKPTDVKFRMVDLNGREVSVFESGRQSKGAHFQYIDVQHLQRGVYVIQMITKDSTKSAKLIVK